MTQPIAFVCLNSDLISTAVCLVYIGESHGAVVVVVVLVPKILHSVFVICFTIEINQFPVVFWLNLPKDVDNVLTSRGSE